MRPSFGTFHRNEWAILGAPCDTIKTLAGQIIEKLSGYYKCAYIDTSHDEDSSAYPGSLSYGAVCELTAHNDFSTLNYHQPLNSIQQRNAFSFADLVLVNGNHHQVKAQVVIIDERKKKSLQKRLEQLTGVQLFLLEETQSEIFDFLKEAIPGWKNIPIYGLRDIARITAFFQDKMQQSKPVLNGLVLAGGKSERMGFDKGAVQWHGKEQRYYMADLLGDICDEVFISCRPEQQALLDSNYQSLPDTFAGLGPFGAILSAFRENPDRAWFVIACDLPMIDGQTLLELVNNRNVSAIATAYKSSINNFPEPLITIWEPKSYPVLLSFLAQGYSCPRKVLINSDTTVIDAADPEVLTNVNTPEDHQLIIRRLQAE